MRVRREWLERDTKRRDDNERYKVQMRPLQTNDGPKGDGEEDCDGVSDAFKKDDDDVCDRIASGSLNKTEKNV